MRALHRCSSNFFILFCRSVKTFQPDIWRPLYIAFTKKILKPNSCKFIFRNYIQLDSYGAVKMRIYKILPKHFGNICLTSIWTFVLYRHRDAHSVICLHMYISIWRCIRLFVTLSSGYFFLKLFGPLIYAQNIWLATLYRYNLLLMTT